MQQSVSMRYVPLLGIGRGGMGRVDLALALGVPGAEQLVVLKRLCEPDQRTEQERQELVFEAQLSARLAHPNIATTLGLDTLDGELIVVLEYLEGASVAALTRLCVAHGRPFPRGVLLRVMSDALAGLDYAHNLADYDGAPLGIVHRDVSPSNIVITIDGITKVLDFGVAKASRSTLDTPPGFIKGKLGYMAPEQILGRPLDRRADLYAVGVMLWEGLTGQRFSPSESLQECLAARLHSEAPAVRELAPTIPAALDQIVQRCLARDASARWPTAAALRAALDAYASSHDDGASTQDVAYFVRHHVGSALQQRRMTVRHRVADLEHVARRPATIPSMAIPRTSSSSVWPYVLDTDSQRSAKAPSTSPPVLPRPRLGTFLPFVAALVGVLGSCGYDALSAVSSARDGLPLVPRERHHVAREGVTTMVRVPPSPGSRSSREARAP